MVDQTAADTTATTTLPATLASEAAADYAFDTTSDTSIVKGLVVGAVGGLIVGVTGVLLALTSDLVMGGFGAMVDSVKQPKRLAWTFFLYFLAGMIGNSLNHYFAITYKLGIDQLAWDVAESKYLTPTSSA